MTTFARRHLNLPGLATLALVLIVWETLVRASPVKFDYLPAPSAVAAAFATLAAGGPLAAETLHTLASVLIGGGIACLIGIALGLALATSAPLRRYTLASIEVLRPMPGIAFLPLALLLFQFSLKTELVVIVYPSVWPVLVNTMGAVSAIPVRLGDVGRTLHLSRAAILRKVMLPAALPAILVGCRLSLGTALVMAIIAEMLANPQGLGAAIVREMQAFQPETMFAYVLFVGMLGLVLNTALQRASEWALPGHFARGQHD